MDPLIYKSIDKLVSYGVMTGLIKNEDKTYVTNRLVHRLGLDSYEPTGEACTDIKELAEI